MDLCDGFFTQKVAGVTIDTIKPKIRALTLPKGISNITLIYMDLWKALQTFTMTVTAVLQVF